MDDYPKYRSHLLPRSRDGWVALVTHAFLNRLEPVILGMPFLYAVLLAVYFALIGVLIWTYKRGV